MAWCPRRTDFHVVSCEHCQAQGRKEWVESRGNHHEAGCPRFTEQLTRWCRDCGLCGSDTWVRSRGQHHDPQCPRFSKEVVEEPAQQQTQSVQHLVKRLPLQLDLGPAKHSAQQFQQESVQQPSQPPSQYPHRRSTWAGAGEQAAEFARSAQDFVAKKLEVTPEPMGRNTQEQAVRIIQNARIVQARRLFDQKVVDAKVTEDCEAFTNSFGDGSFALVLAARLG